MNNNKKTDILFLDQVQGKGKAKAKGKGRAFDTVPHKRLLNKLNYYCITGPTLQTQSIQTSDSLQIVDQPNIEKCSRIIFIGIVC